MTLNSVEMEAQAQFFPQNTKSAARAVFPPRVNAGRPFRWSALRVQEAVADETTVPPATINTKQARTETFTKLICSLATQAMPSVVGSLRSRCWVQPPNPCPSPSVEVRA